MIESPFVVIQVLFPWRLYYYIQSRKSESPVAERIKLSVHSFCNGILDVPFCPLFIVLMLTGLFTKKLITCIRQKTLTRSKILVMFIKLLVTIVLLIVCLANILCLVRAPAVIFSLYQYFQGKLDDISLLKDIAKHTFHTVTFPLLSLIHI